MVRIVIIVRLEMNVVINMLIVFLKIVFEEMMIFVYENVGFVMILFIFGVLGNVVVVGVLCCNVKIYKW